MRIGNAHWIKLFVILCVVVLFLSPATVSGGIEYPKPEGAINDFAGIIPQNYERRMESLALEVLQKTGTAIVVATVKSVGDIDYSTYASELYQSWGIGKKGDDKGVLIFLAVKERKLKIETGYGVEGILPDGLVGQVMDDYMVPYLRKNEFGKGMLNGMFVLAGIIAKDAGVKLGGQVAARRPLPKKQSCGVGILPVILFIILLLALSRSRGGFLPLLLLMMMMGGGRGGGFGGGFGSFGGGFGGFGGGLSGGGGAGRSF